MSGATLCIRQEPLHNDYYPIRLTLKRPNQADQEAKAQIKFALSAQQQQDLRWYMEDYLQQADTVVAEHVQQIETMLQQCGEELYRQVLTANANTQAIWFAIRDQLADLRIEISTEIREAASIPWELMRDPEADSALAVRVQAFVRVQANPNLPFVPPPTDNETIRLLYIVCRPKGANDVELRAVANRLLQQLDKSGKRASFEIDALRPPTYPRLQQKLTWAKQQGRPYHIVHFDGHGSYADHGYLAFEQPDESDNTRRVYGDELGKLLHDTGVLVLILNACQSAMSDIGVPTADDASVHQQVRAIGSLAQAVVDQGIPAVLGMRYSAYVVTAAQYIGELYAGLAQGLSFGQAASQARKHLQRNPERELGLQRYRLQDWSVPVVYEAQPLPLLNATVGLSLKPSLDPVQHDQTLRRYVPDSGFIGRDETLLMLDRAFDSQPVVLLHAYAGQGKTSVAVEFARWYAQTGGLGVEPIVLFSSFAQHTDLIDALNQIGQCLIPVLLAHGIDWYALNDVGQRRHLILQLLRQIPVLWIWDNVESVAGFPHRDDSAWTKDEQQALADFLKQLKLDQATQAKILLTSRRDEQPWLGGVAKRIKMPPMSLSDAGALALTLGEERGLKRSELSHWQPLLDYCAGNPLTLRVLIGQALYSGLRARGQIDEFILKLRSGEQAINDLDREQGRDRSLAASLDYGFRHVFAEQELPIIALLSLFQGVVDVIVLQHMGLGDDALPSLQGRSADWLHDLLNRACDTGLLSRLSNTKYSIHPVLPWFLRQVFAQYYDGQQQRPTEQSALRAWLEAIGELGDYYMKQFIEGRREVITALGVEETNLLHARRIARDYAQCRAVLTAMQGLKTLYQYQGRFAEWARLVESIVPDYCTEADQPVAGREEWYSLVMGYRVELAQDQQRDLTLAAALQDKQVQWDKLQAAAALALPEAQALDAKQHNLIRTLVVSLARLGHILREQGDSASLSLYRAAIIYYQRIGDSAGEAIAQFNLGHAYKNIVSVCDLDASLAAYQRSLDLHNEGDVLGRSACLHQIGRVEHDRFNEARQRLVPPETLAQLAKRAESYYLDALALCPKTALTDLGPIHNQLGNLYKDLGRIEAVREHYEKCVQLAEQTDDRYGAGGTRHNLSLLYEAAAQQQTGLAQQALLQRALAYAQAALRDFQTYQGRATDWEANAQQLIDRIKQRLTGDA